MPSSQKSHPDRCKPKREAIALTSLIFYSVMADLHNYANCYSRIQPIGNNNSCPKKRGVLLESVSLEKRSYADVSHPPQPSILRDLGLLFGVMLTCSLRLEPGGDHRCLQLLPQPQHRQQAVGQVP